MSTEAMILATLVFGFTVVGAVCDVRTRRLPNWLTVSAFALGLTFHAVVGFLTSGRSGLGQELMFSLAGFATGFSILLVLWFIGGSGAGDVKMMGAIGAWLGTKLTLLVFLCSAMFVAVASLAIITGEFLRRGILATRRRYLERRETKSETQRLSEAGRRRIMPYGVPLALATWSVVGIHLWHQWNH